MGKQEDKSKNTEVAGGGPSSAVGSLDSSALYIEIVRSPRQHRRIFSGAFLRFAVGSLSYRALGVMQLAL